jgi:hypothetical protein
MQVLSTKKWDEGHYRHRELNNNLFALHFWQTVSEEHSRQNSIVEQGKHSPSLKYSLL